MIKNFCGIIGLILLATTGPVWAGLADHHELRGENKSYHWNSEQTGYHCNSEQTGWFWYQDINQNQLGKPPMPSESEMMAMHPEELRRLCEAHLKYSVHTGLPEDIANWQKVQNVIVKKSAMVAGVKETTHRQFTSASKSSEVTQVLEESKDDFALALFTVNNCLACHAQKKTLMRFKEFYDWKVKEFNAQENSKLVKDFNIRSAPTIILIRKSPPQWSQISVGKTPLADIEKTVAAGVKVMKEV